MVKSNRNPLWFAIPAALAGVYLYFRSPEHHTFLFFMLGGLALILIAQTGMFVMNKVNPPPVPGYAISNLVDQCEHSQDEWILVEFEPKLDLTAARVRAGTAEYSQSDRRNAFLNKARLYSPHVPSVGFFHSANKGYLLARRSAVHHLVERYGRWTIDTWYALEGAAKKLDIDAESLDEPKVVRFGIEA